MSRNLLRDEDNQVLDLDDSTGGIPTVDRFDVHLHAGRLFEGSHIFPSVDNNTTVKVHFKTSSVNDTHMILSVVLLGEAQVELLEAPAVTANGTIVTTYNANRQSTTVADGIFYHTPTVTVATGATLFSSVFPGGRVNQANGFVGFARERMLKQNTSYVLSITNKAGVAKDITSIIEFYEELHSED
jgi:hypothetical protein